MPHYESILYVSQGLMDETEGLAMAAQLAARNEARLEVLLTSPTFPAALHEHGKNYHTLLTDGLRCSLVEVAGRAGYEGTDPHRTRITVEAGPAPSLRIIRHALQREQDLIIKQADRGDSSRGYRAIDMDLLRQSPCPVLLLKGDAKPLSDEAVAVAIDPKSEDNHPAHFLNMRMLARARRLADMGNGELHIISCWYHDFQSLLVDNPLLSKDDPEVIEQIEKVQGEHRLLLDNLIDEAGISGKITVHHLKGMPDKEIPKAAEALGIDLLVMGTLARSGLKGFLIGNTAENILNQLTCSLMAMKPANFESPIKPWDE